MDTDNTRSMVEAAFNELATETGVADGSGSADASPDAGVESGGAGVLDEQPGQASAGQGQDRGDDGGAVATAAQRARDERGKFTKAKDNAAKAVAPTKRAAQSTAPASTVGSSPSPGDAASIPTPPVETARAPQSWTPAAREAWNSLPPEVKGHPGVKAIVEDAARREKEIAATMEQQAPIRRYAQESQAALAPYAQFAQSIGQTPLNLARQASQIALEISTGPMHVRADRIAALIQGNGIPVELINQRLGGEAPTQQGQQQNLDPAQLRAQLREELRQDFQQERFQAQTARLTTEVKAFYADPKNEFVEDVGPRMLALIQSDPKLSLQDAYEEAVWSRKDLRDILQKREAAKQAKATTASTQQARLAASSVRSTPSTGATAARKAMSEREMVAAAYDATIGSGGR